MKPRLGNIYRFIEENKIFVVESIEAKRVFCDYTDFDSSIGPFYVNIEDFLQGKVLEVSELEETLT